MNSIYLSSDSICDLFIFKTLERGHHSIPLKKPLLAVTVSPENVWQPDPEKLRESHNDIRIDLFFLDVPLEVRINGWQMGYFTYL